MNYNNYYNLDNTGFDDRQLNDPENMPEVLTAPIYTPGFLRTQIGKLMRVEFLIGTTNLEDRVGVLEEVGASFIILRSVEGNTKLFCDLYSIKFITITTQPFTYNPVI